MDLHQTNAEMISGPFHTYRQYFISPAKTDTFSIFVCF